LGAAPAMGAPAGTPGASLAALEETVAIMRAMWSGERRGLRFEGSYYQLSGVHPGPAPAHRIEIWIGANRPRALAPTGGPAARAAGRDPGEIRRIFLIPGAFTSTFQAPASDTDQAIVGPPEQWAEALTHFATDLGFGTFVLAAPPDPETLTTFIEVVAPKVREGVAERRAGA